MILEKQKVEHQLDTQSQEFAKNCFVKIGIGFQMSNSFIPLNSTNNRERESTVSFFYQHDQSHGHTLI